MAAAERGLRQRNENIYAIPARQHPSEAFGCVFVTKGKKCRKTIFGSEAKNIFRN
jgi:hypothetical protein